MNANETHVLLRHARTSRRVDRDLTPPGCHYDLSTGAWVVDATGALLAETPGRPGPHTKKNDIETGEDQKGE
jgi:hypothetical protein